MKNNTWSLDILYSGFDDPKFQADFNLLNDKLQACIDLQANLENYDHTQGVKAILNVWQDFQLLAARLTCYSALSQSVNATDPEIASYLSQIMQKISNSSKTFAQFDKYIASIDNLADIIAENEDLQEFAYILTNIKENGKYQLSDDVEEMISKLNLSAGAAWEEMHSYLTSTLKVDYNGEEVTLSHIRNLAYDENKEVRKSAYEAEIKSYDKIKDAIAYSLNNIKSQVNTVVKARGFDNALDYTLHQSHMKKETLDAMFEAMNEYMPYFHQYLKRKGELLGHENGLPWYELFAPLGDASRKFDVEEAKTYLIDHFQGFSKDLAEMVEEAFDNEWIDFFPRNGKRGGAFCYGVPGEKESRIMTNFNGELGDVVTLAHELGHAYHNRQIEGYSILNSDYSMPVAETASTFNENIIMNAAIDEASDEDKLVLIENQLQDLAQIICDIYSRFLFEKEVFERRQNEFLFAPQLEEIMMNAQKQAYGDGLDHSCLHPYMWINKGHYYSSDLSFYNFPYAFGGLFARGLVVKYQEMGEDFLPKYKELLKATPLMDVEDVAKLLDIDLTKKEFWVSALETAKERIEQFLELSKKVD